MQYLLKRTITEEYEYDRNLIISDYWDEFQRFMVTRQEERKLFGHSKLTREQLEDEFLIALFESHEGSRFCDEKLFSSTASDDYGIELRTREDDE